VLGWVALLLPFFTLGLASLLLDALGLVALTLVVVVLGRVAFALLLIVFGSLSRCVVGTARHCRRRGSGHGRSRVVVITPRCRH